VSVTPTLSPTPLSSPSPVETPPATPQSTPSPTPHTATLEISATGDIYEDDECHLLRLNMGGCLPYLVVDPLGIVHAAAWTPYQPAIRFDERTEPWQYARQANLPPGTYGIALALELGSDVPTCELFTPPPGDSYCRYGKVVCVAEVKVAPITERVIVTADYGSPCQLRVRTLPWARLLA
jgi:hypothetical protein